MAGAAILAILAISVSAFLLKPANGKFRRQ
jgi:hypothetical protein